MIKKLFVSILTILLFAILTFGKNTSPTPTAEETKEAQELAAKFYNRLAETQDIMPLIDEFFISDFNKRVNYCYKTGFCGGFGRDFWTEFDENISIIKSKVDFQNFYINSINCLYLLMRTVIYLSPEIVDNNKDLPEKVIKENAKRELKLLLKNNPKLLKSALRVLQFNTKKESFIDLLPPKFKSINQFRSYQNKIARTISLLKPIEAHLRFKKQKINTNLSFVFSPKDFRVDIVDSKEFFNYSNKTKMIEVWDNIHHDKTQTHKYLPFKMDLIKENGKLKIVAIYPPMD